MEKQDQTFYVTASASFVVDGDIVSPGETVELSRPEAENLLGRGLVTLANDEAVKAIEEQAQKEAEEIAKAQADAIEAQKRQKETQQLVTSNRRAELDAMTVAELKALAAEKAIDLGDASRKDDIVSAIVAVEQDEA